MNVAPQPRWFISLGFIDYFFGCGLQEDAERTASSLVEACHALIPGIQFYVRGMVFYVC